MLLSSAHDELDAERAKEPTLKTDYRSKLAQAVNLGELRKQKLQVEEYVTQLEKQLPGKAEMDALLSDINQAGLGRGLQFELFRPGQVAVKDYYAELPIAIKVDRSLSRHRLVRRRHRQPFAHRDPAQPESRDSRKDLHGACWHGSHGAHLSLSRRRPRSRRSARTRPRRRSAGSEEMSGRAARRDRRHVSSPASCCADAAGCVDDQDELQQWMEQQKREVKPNVEPLSRAEEVQSAALRRRSARRAVQHAKADGRPQAGSAAAEFAAGGRDQPAQGAARGLSRRQHGDGRQRGPRRPSLRAAESRQPALPGQAGRLPWPELRKDHSRSPRPTWPTAKSFKTRRANGSSATAPSSFRRRRDEQHLGESEWSSWRSRMVARACGWERAFPAWSQNVDPVDQQLAAGGRRGDAHRAERSRWRRCRPASPSRRRRASRSTCPASPTRSASRRSRSTRATCARSASPRPATARASS